MARAESGSPWPLALGAGAALGGLLWWRGRKAEAAPAPARPDLATADTLAAASAPMSAQVDAAPAPMAPPVPAPVPRPVAAPVTAPSAPGPAPGGRVPRPPFVPHSMVPPILEAAAGAPPAPAVTAVSPMAAAPAPAVTAAVEAPRWVWPLPSWQGRAPVVSDGWGSPRDGGARVHKGADLMYRRRSRADLVTEFPPRPPHSELHFMPPATPVLAARDGVIWSAQRTPRGLAVVIDHGAPWATYYQHLARLYVPLKAPGAGGVRVRAGQAIGVVGGDPTATNVAHLHFEIWRGGDGRAAIDPMPFLRGWPVLERAIEAPRASEAPDPRAAIYLDQIFARHGRGLPVAYLRALARAESGLNAFDPKGVINVVKVALDEYNRLNPGVMVEAGRLRDPAVSVSVAAWILHRIIASYRAHHADVVNLREDWTNPRFVELLSAGWNAGFSERAGVGRVVDYLKAHRQEISIDSVWRFARQAGAADTLSNPHKLRFARRVAEDFARMSAGGGA